jgi:hypothetical protein
LVRIQPPLPKKQGLREYSRSFFLVSYLKYPTPYPTQPKEIEVNQNNLSY